MGISPHSSYEAGLAFDPKPGADEAEISSFAITCVMFEDGSSEGIHDYIAMIDQLRKGRQLQIKRLLPLLETLRQKPTEGLLDALDETITRIDAMDITLEDGTQAPGLVASAVRDTNSQIIEDLRNARRIGARDKSVVRAEIDAMIVHHHVLSSALDRASKKQFAKSAFYAPEKAGRLRNIISFSECVSLGIVIVSLHGSSSIYISP